MWNARLKHWFLPKIRCSMHQTRPSTLFSPIFSRAREKIWPSGTRQKRPRRNESLQARLLILCARFFLSKPQTEFAVWVFLCKSAATSQSACGCQHPYPFCPFGTFPPDRGNRPLEGEPGGCAPPEVPRNRRRPLRRCAPAPLKGEPGVRAHSQCLPL